MMLNVMPVSREMRTAIYGLIKQVLEASVAYGWLRGYELRQVWTL